MSTTKVDVCANCQGLIELLLTGPRHIEAGNRQFSSEFCDDRILRATPKGLVIEVKREELFNV